MNDLVTEFFIDIITRVIPGFVVLAFYPDKLFTIVFSKFHDLPLLLIPCLIGAAWVVGFAIERATYVPFAIIFSLFPKKYKHLHHLIGDQSHDDCFNSNNSDLKNGFNFFKFNRRHEQKLASERIFCRAMCAISLASCFWFPTSTFLKCNRWPSIRVFCHNIPCYCILGVFIFGVAWIWAEFFHPKHTANPQK